MWTVVRENTDRVVLYHKQTALLFVKVKGLKVRNI